MIATSASPMATIDSPIRHGLNPPTRPSEYEWLGLKPNPYGFFSNYKAAAFRVLDH